MVQGGVTYMYVKSHLGSIKLVVNATTGAVTQRLDYDAWGSVASDSAPGFQPFAFAGGVYDPDTKLTHFGYRDYDSLTGSWTAKDPIRLDGGFNFYSYTMNSPTTLVDPLGLIGLADGPTPSEIRDWRNAHYRRNDQNEIPARETVMTQWIKMSYAKTRYHRFNGQTQNEKCVSPNGSCEAVFSGSELVTDSANQGTFNFSDQNGQPLGHILLDVIPYYFWGNTPDDPTPFWRRVYGTD